MKKKRFPIFPILLVVSLTALLVLNGCQKKGAFYPVMITNNSTHEVCSVKFYLAGSYHMPTKNLLRRSLFRLNKIAPGESLEVRIPEGVYDIRIATCDELWWGEDMFSAPERDTWTISDDRLTTISK